MKRIKNPRRTSFFATLLALVGLGTPGCFVEMYGSPYATWSVKGKVTDNEGKPIPGLQVVLGNRYENSADVIYDENYRPLDTLETGQDGTYQLESNGFPINLLQVDVHDIDGPENGGEFEDASLVIRDINYEGGKGWNSGHADIKVPDIRLKKK